MDAIHYKIKDEGKIVNKAAYVVLGINIERYKDVLGLWIGESESFKFWLGVLNDLKTRGVEEVLLFCVDGLTGFKGSNRSSVPEKRYSKVYYSSAQKFVQVCFIQAYKRVFEGF
jgi:transposase-like protein